MVGAGAFGRNHLRVYRELEQAGVPVKLAAVVDPNEAPRSAATAKYAIPGFASIDECLAACKPDAASLCVPTVHHAACAQTLLAAGVDLLIEKPIAAGLAEADEIVRLARELGRTVQVGHLERFNPAVRAVRGLLNHPMFFEVHRLSVFTPRSLDVDVVLDLMIHDLDLVLSLVASPVRELRAVGLPVLSPRVDIANVRLEFENGCVANLTASRVSTERVRKMRFFQPHQYLSLDFARQDLPADRRDGGLWAGSGATGRAGQRRGGWRTVCAGALLEQGPGRAGRAVAPGDRVVPGCGARADPAGGDSGGWPGSPGPGAPDQCCDCVPCAAHGAVAALTGSSMFWTA